MVDWSKWRNFFARSEEVGLAGFPYWRHLLLGVMVYLALVVILLANLAPKQVNLQVGQVSTRDIEAPRTIIDQVRTEELQRQAAERALEILKGDPRNYLINQAEARVAEDAVREIFGLLRAFQRRQTEGDKVAQETALRLRLEKEYGVVLKEETLVSGLKAPPEDLENLRRVTMEIVGAVMLTERIEKDTLPQARQRLEREVEARQISWRYRPLVLAIGSGVLRPNLILDPEKVERTRETAIQSVEPVRILKGQAIIRKGDVVTKEHLRILRDLGIQTGEVNYQVRVGAVFLILILLALLVVYLYQYERWVLARESLAALLGVVIVVLVFTAKVLASIPWAGSSYLTPVAFATMVVAILLEAKLAVVTGIILALLTGLAAGLDFRVTLAALISGMVGVFMVSRVSQRGDLMRAGGVVGLVSFLAMAAIGLLTGENLPLERSYIGIINGIVSSIFTIGSLPYLESIFGITSSVRLLELSNPNQPLLRSLLLKAPGTYHHSIMVGNLAEAAAEAVGADPLLARVGAYYHDVGKLKRPYFFVENQMAAENPHDKLSPTLSTLIITSHVKDGLELAREYRLPRVVADIIQQHHGDDLVRYFYFRATEHEHDQPISEEDFRYDGPKPQSKEAAIVMLADSVEAAVRAMEKPTPSKVEAVVRRIIRERLSDGQLDECDLTLRDLNRIGDAFLRVLSGIFHTRLEYPEKLLKEAERGRGTSGKGKGSAVRRKEG